jgi:hypothetical protein
LAASTALEENQAMTRPRPVTLLAGALFACAATALAAQGSAGSGGAGAAGGIAWKVPAGWTSGKSNPMRVATYVVPAAKGAAAGECSVFYFGPGQGGGVDENVARWSRQFEGNPPARRSSKTVSGLGVTLAEVEGTYLNPGGGMMVSQGKKSGYRLLGAIVEAPQGNVFFKATGPAATIAAAHAAFDGLVASIVKK